MHLPIISDLLDQERQNAEAVIMKKQCAMNRWLLTHAEHSATTITFMFPIRLVAGVVVSCLLMSGGLASIDYLALRQTSAIKDVEATYNNLVVPFLKDDVGVFLTPFAQMNGLEGQAPLPSYHNS